ncbi:hypothetical protein KP509_22G074500 [Ceratopteris richardii]|uniref:EF-hand domain-containing protein n=1 Tax=Ceratopteris richardii TaxID=49495 RepID=A0A8T2S6E6_CERRI|nr:hypothetical protein KP509_22G074500 [Ceratopteris richardii]
MALEMHDECIDTVKIPWRGNRRSSFAQEFHASERERETERPSLLPFKGTANYDRDDAVSFSTESPRPQKSSGVLTLKALKELKKAFDALGTLTTNGRLDKEGFVRECMRIDEMQAYVSKMEMEQLFMKVDVNNNGSVDWNDFTSFILLHQLAKEDGLVSEFSPYVKVRTQNNKSFDELSEESESDKEEEDAVECVPPKSHKCLESGDVAMLRPSPVIEKIIKLNAIQTYVSCSQDGYLKLWHTDSLKLLRVQENGNGAWISDITAMAQQPLAVFAMDRSITFYDTGRLSFDVLGRIKNLVCL